jgi:hypothetical protein
MKERRRKKTKEANKPKTKKMVCVCVFVVKSGGRYFSSSFFTSFYTSLSRWQNFHVHKSV